MSNQRISTRVSKTDRAGRAPYNFVPLADRAVAVNSLPSFHSYRNFENPDVSYYSGEISYELEALTPFYTRGMWSLDRYLEARNSTKDGGKVEVQREPFNVAGRLRLPGSSLRGMIRCLVEILGKAPLEPVTDQQLFFRAVGATSNPRFRSFFEPQAVAYKDLIGEGAKNVKAGYLTAAKDGSWFIQPAKTDAKYKQSFFKIHMPTMKWWDREGTVYFLPNERKSQPVPASTPGAIKGRQVCSGHIPKKNSQWAILEIDSAAAPVEIPPADVAAYRESGISQLIRATEFRIGRNKMPKKNFEYTDNSYQVPCFYVVNQIGTGTDSLRRVSFGHTPFFRLAYRRTVADAIPQENSRKRLDEGRDVAQAIFGFVDKSRESRRGRIYFEDAILTDPAKESPDIPTTIVLGTPKPTTYQHYLVQAQESEVDSIQWDGNKDGKGTVTVRGHKLYWHRPEAWRSMKEAEADQKSVASTWSPVGSGARFVAKIRYENLRDYELGALLSALQLPAGCAHHLGMGKPLGLGSFRLQITNHLGIDRKKRYESLFADQRLSMLTTGANPLDNPEQFTKAFAEKFYKVTDIWKNPRLAELRALLDFDRPKQIKDWTLRTRYLQFGQLADGRNYNEYTHVGDLLAKRRPLPPASQVLNDAKLPNDPWRGK